MTTLHILNASPTASSQLRSCLRVAAAQDAILFTGEAVQALRTGSAALQQLCAGAQEYRLYALQEDITARAIEVGELPVTLVDYPAFVALSIASTRVNSWT